MDGRKMTFSSCYCILFEFDQRQKQNKESPSPQRGTDAHEHSVHLTSQHTCSRKTLVVQADPHPNEKLVVFASRWSKYSAKPLF